MENEAHDGGGDAAGEGGDETAPAQTDPTDIAGAEGDAEAQDDDDDEDDDIEITIGDIKNNVT